MRRFSTLFVLSLLLTPSGFSQWCIPTESPTTMNTYGSTSPVITNVTFNTINRTTAQSNKELYVHTGEGTSVEVGQSIPFSMTHYIDQPVCPQMHIRIWIDWNIDGDFDDAYELALSTDETSSTTFSGTIDVPADAAIGVTRMRVAYKMVQSCGHSTPDPCVPSESFGWHGEIEDYDLTVSAQVGIDELSIASNIVIMQSLSGIDLQYQLHAGASVELEIYDLLGQLVHVIPEAARSVGEQSIHLDASVLTTRGTYLAALVINGQPFVRKVVKSN